MGVVFLLGVLAGCGDGDESATPTTIPTWTGYASCRP